MASALGMIGPPRVLPITIAAAGLLLVLRVAELWTDVSVSVAGQAEAQVSLETLIIPAGGAAKEDEASGHDEPAPEEHDEPASEEHGAADEAADEHVVAADTHAEDSSLPLPDLLGAPTFTPAEIEVLTELAKRRENLDGRERELGLREGLLQAAERRFDDKIVELQALRSEIEALVGQQDEEDEAELQSLVKIYETMKPKDAARILQELEMRILLPIMERMKERSMAPVLAAMDSGRARAVTAELSRRRDLGVSDG